MRINGRARPKVVVITGASAGVGRAIVRRYAKRGAKIGLVARGLERLEDTRREVEMLGGRALALPADVADASALFAAAHRVEEELGPIDLWINNAMTSVYGDFTEITPEEYRRVTEVVYHGTVFGTMAALRHMIPRGKGTIVFVGSALAYRGIPLQSAYCGAKHAIQGLFESLRSELLHDGSKIKLAIVQLPAINTPQFGWARNKLNHATQPIPPIYQPEVAADAILYAAEHGRREMYVGFSSMKAIIGNKIAPALGDHYLARKGYDQQQLRERDESDRPDNLFHHVPGHQAAHGRFDSRARRHSLQLAAAKHRGLMGLAMVMAGMWVVLHR